MRRCSTVTTPELWDKKFLGYGINAFFLWISGRVFFVIRERDAAAAGLRRDFSRGAYSPGAPQGGALIAPIGRYKAAAF